MVLIFCLSHNKPILSAVAGDWSFPGIDKIAHFCEFMILFFLTYRALFNEGYKNAELKALVFSVLYALSDEVHQSFLIYRDCEIGDFMADSAGALIGFAIIKLLNRRTR